MNSIMSYHGPRRAQMPAFRPLVLTALFVAPVLGWGVLPGVSSAQDVRHSCSEKYQAAKAAGTLGEESWPQFYSRCAAEMRANPAAAAAPAAAEAAPLDVRHICSQKYQAAKAAGTLAGQSWPQFYSRCTAEIKANPPAAEATPPAEKAPVPPPAPVVEAPPPPPPPAPVVETPPPPQAPAPVAQAPAPPPAAAPVNPLKKPAAKPVTPAPATQAAPGTAVFPSAIAPEYANEKPAKARMKTCEAQYKANKVTNANGGLKWIQKGGGYWSECNKHLKAQG
jgi:hypothetical protein